MEAFLLPLEDQDPPQTITIAPLSTTLEVELPVQPLSTRATHKRIRYTPKRKVSNHFHMEFNSLVARHSANLDWYEYSQKHQSKCTKSSCINALLGFCAITGGEFAELAARKEFRSLGTRTKCTASSRSKLRTPRLQTSPIASQSEVKEKTEPSCPPLTFTATTEQQNVSADLFQNEVNTFT